MLSSEHLSLILWLFFIPFVKHSVILFVKAFDSAGRQSRFKSCFFLLWLQKTSGKLLKFCLSVPVAHLRRGRDNNNTYLQRWWQRLSEFITNTPTNTWHIVLNKCHTVSLYCSAFILQFISFHSNVISVKVGSLSACALLFPSSHKSTWHFAGVQQMLVT